MTNDQPNNKLDRDVQVMPGVYFTSKEALQKEFAGAEATAKTTAGPQLNLSSVDALLQSLPHGQLTISTLKDNLRFFKQSVKQLVRSQAELREYAQQPEFRDDRDVAAAISENHTTLVRFIAHIETLQTALERLGAGDASCDASGDDAAPTDAGN